MSCSPGKPCWEGFKRRRALALLALMGAIFLALSAFSFLDSRGQVVPREVHYAGFDAVAGKRVFQSFNCMGCHTIVGNGAYFGPDLTKLYDRVGPAWLEAFLPSAGGWPTEAAVNLKLQDAGIATESGVGSIGEYLEKYPAAAERITRRGGHPTAMPNLPLTHDDVAMLIAFLKYTSAMNTEGWPPKPKVDGLDFPQAVPLPGASRALPDGSGADGAAAPLTGVALGKELASSNGCLACHATDGKRVVGPGGGGLYGSTVRHTDGSTSVVDDEYLAESILDPDARIVDGYVAHTMPSFEKLLDPDQVAAIVAYIRSLGGK